MSDPSSDKWAIGYQAFIDAEGRGGVYTREPVRWDGRHWESLVGRGAWSPQYVTSVTPLYMVSLDAAIEEAARHLAEAEHGAAYWLEATEQTRGWWRNKLRPTVTAAVMGGAQ